MSTTREIREAMASDDVRDACELFHAATKVIALTQVLNGSVIQAVVARLRNENDKGEGRALADLIVGMI